MSCFDLPGRVFAVVNFRLNHLTRLDHLIAKFDHRCADFVGSGRQQVIVASRAVAQPPDEYFDLGKP